MPGLRFPGGRALGEHYTLYLSDFWSPPFTADRLGGYSIARIGRAHSDRARTASM